MDVTPEGETATLEIQLTWPLPPTVVELGRNQIHVWSAWLFHPCFDDYTTPFMLTPEESERSAKFYFERDRRSFIVRRSLLRAILASYLKMEPAEVPLAHEERGKPFLSLPNGEIPFHFNFSHSRGVALCAISALAPVGVDVEKLRLIPELAEVAATFCSEQEKERLHSVVPRLKLETFFNIWTRKEAYLKATGEGIAGALAQLDCSQTPAGWTLENFSPAPGFAAAVAFPATGAETLCWRWERPVV